MDEKKYRDFLKEKKLEEENINKYIEKLKNFESYLEKEQVTIETLKADKLINYTEFLVEKDKEAVLGFLRVLLNYSYFSKRNDLIEALIDIFESYTAMDNLYLRIAEWYGEEIRDEIFSEITIPPLGVHPEKKPETTKVVLKRIEEKLGEEKLIGLLKPCLHEGYVTSRNIKDDRKEYQELGIDAFLEKVKEEQVKSFEKNRDEGTPAFAQEVDSEVVEYVKNLETSAIGKREGNIIYITKIPYQVKKLLHTNDDNLKRFYACYCPWVRGAIKEGTENEVSEHFCQCSGGWYKEYFDQLFEQEVKIEPVETALTGVPYCKFAVYLPDNIIIK